MVTITFQTSPSIARNGNPIENGVTIRVDGENVTDQCSHYDVDLKKVTLKSRQVLEPKETLDIMGAT